MKTRNTQTGVTLIELMVTIAIIAIIASIAIPAYTGYIVTAKKSECLNEISAIQLALEEYYLENNEYYAGDLSYSSTTLISNSKGLYKNSTTAAERNCAYSVVTTGADASGYTLTVTGVNELAGVSSGPLKVVSKP